MIASLDTAHIPPQGARRGSCLSAGGPFWLAKGWRRWQSVRSESADPSWPDVAGQPDSVGYPEELMSLLVHACCVDCEDHRRAAVCADFGCEACGG